MDEEDGLRLVCSRAAGTAVAAGRLGRAAVTTIGGSGINFWVARGGCDYGKGDRVLGCGGAAGIYLGQQVFFGD
jgi:hypothetical protein